MTKADLHRKLYELQDLTYRDMQIKIIPSINPESVIGVRTPELRTMTKELLKSGDYKVFKKHRESLLKHIKKWLRSKEPYTIRFGIGMLMEHFLDEDFDPVYPEMVAKLRNKEYYVNMMIAWYFATALAKQYESILPFIEEKRLETWTHNKAIQKSIESNRIPYDRKDYLKSLKVSRSI